MLTSLFGDLGPIRRDKHDVDDDGDDAFQATAIMESVATVVNAQGQMVDRHSRDLVVSGSPAQAIRDHFASTRSDLDTATSLITLVDPAGVWAGAVIKALSDASGRPIERLNLRDRATLRTLATIERTTLARRDEDALRIYRADVRAPGAENAEIPVALMERSQLTAVIIGPLQPHAIDALLAALHAASLLPTWRCPNLLFMLPPNAVWIANKIGTIGWPGRLQVEVLSESLTGASSVWNALLGVWNQVKLQPAWEDSQTAALAATDDFPIKVGSIGVAQPGAAAEPGTAGAHLTVRPALRAAAVEPSQAQAALAGLLALDGLIGCAIAELTTGMVIARASAERFEPVDLDLASAACAQFLTTQRHAARSMGLTRAAEEIVTSAGPRVQILRSLPLHPELFLLVLLDKRRNNLALARFQIRDFERALG